MLLRLVAAAMIAVLTIGGASAQGVSPGGTGVRPPLSLLNRGQPPFLACPAPNDVIPQGVYQYINTCAPSGEVILTLPPAASYTGSNNRIVIADRSLALNASNYIAIAPSPNSGGSDTINGSTTALAELTWSSPADIGWIVLASDGVSNWNIIAQSPTAGTGGSQFNYATDNLTIPASVPSSLTFTTTAIGQNFPLQGPVKLVCATNPTWQMSGQTAAYPPQSAQASLLKMTVSLPGSLVSGTVETMVVNVTAVYAGGGNNCASWSIHSTASPYTRIGLYQINGLQITNNSGGSNFVINGGSVRDSGDTVDLVYSGGTLSYLSGSSRFSSAAGTGTISGATSIVGTSTNFTTAFSAMATLTDLSNQLSVLNLPAVSFPSVITNTNSPGNATAATTTVTDSAHLTTNGSLSASSGSSYTRGGILNTTAAVAYGIILAYHTLDGTVAPFAVSFTPSGTPDIPLGYSYYRVIGYVVIGAANAVQAIAQPLVANVLTTPGDIPYFGSTTAYSGTYSSYLQRLPIGSQYNVLTANSTPLPSWGQVALNQSAAVTGVLGTAHGGTGTSGAVFSTATNVLSGDVTLNASTYTDGPSMAQGTSGTWFASGTVTINDTATDAVNCKLWDATTIISSGSTGITTASKPITLSLSGYLASPAANIRISCISNNATTTKLKANQSGNSADSTIWGIRIN